MNNSFKLILSLSLSGSIVALILFAVRPLIKESFSKAWQYYIWLVVILRLLIPYSPEISFMGNLFDNIETVAAEQVINLAPTVPDAETKENTDGQGLAYKQNGQTKFQQWKERNYDYPDYFWFIWILVAFLLFAIKVFQFRSFIYYVRAGSCIVTNGEMLGLFHQTKNELMVKKRILLYQSNLVKSPMLIGLFKPVIVIPDNSLDFENLKYVFKHELIHFKRFDICYKWLVQLTVCIHWFNPLIHIMSRQINILCEFSCDEAISGGLDAAGKMEYCNTIVNAVSFSNAYKGNSISMTLCEEKKNLKERLGAIMKGEKESRGILVLSVVLLAVLCCTAIFLGAFSADGYGRKSMKEASAYPSGGAKVIDDHEDIKKIVIVDPGHGGADTGAVYTNGNDIEIKEKELNLKISLLLRDMLKESGVNVELTRQQDRKLTLEDRIKLANDLNASLFVSIHFDSSPDTTQKGTLVLYNSSNDNSIYGTTGQQAAQLVHDEIADKLETEDAGVIIMSKSLKYYNLKMPTVIIELASMSNESDRKSFMAEGFDSEAAKALHDGIISVLNEM